MDKALDEKDREAAIQDLIAVMRRLRNPDGGCPWDVEQTFATIAPYTIEEAYEVAEAIADDDMVQLKDELGDLLFQVIFHSQMADEAGQFDFHDVAAAVVDKMIRRHPHVFGDQDGIDSAAIQTGNWERQKAEERSAKARAAGRAPSALDGVTLGLPALLRAIKLQNRAARVGFDWPSPVPVLDKIEEEIAEFKAEVAQGSAPDRMIDEFGDILFVYANLARHYALDPEAALRQANAKFERRFRRVEVLLAAAGKSPETSTLEEMDTLWDQVKAEERVSGRRGKA
jgi:MazG family protein